MIMNFMSAIVANNRLHRRRRFIDCNFPLLSTRLAYIKVIYLTLEMMRKRRAIEISLANEPL